VGFKLTPRQKFSVTSVGVIFNLWGLKLPNPPTNRTLFVCKLESFYHKLLQFETSVSSSTMISERPPMFGKLCHAASLCSASFVIMSPTTAFVHWLCHLYTLGSTTAISSWSGFRHIYNGNSGPFSTLQLVWCFVYTATTMSQTPLQFCTDCVYHSGSTSRWLSWRFVYYTV